MGKIKLDDFSHIQLYAHPKYTQKAVYRQTLHSAHSDNQQQPATRTKLIPNNTDVVQSSLLVQYQNTNEWFLQSSSSDTYCCLFRIVAAKCFSFLIFFFLCRKCCDKTQVFDRFTQRRASTVAHTRTRDTAFTLSVVCALFHILLPPERFGCPTQIKIGCEQPIAGVYKLCIERIIKLRLVRMVLS